VAGTSTRPGAGIGLRTPHHAEVERTAPPVALLEVHSENYFGAGGGELALLERLRARYPLSLHGVGLSIGSVDALDGRHLAAIERLVRRFEPAFVSEHLSWSSVDGRHANDLLPLPHTRAALDHVVARIGALQERLGRQIAVENIASYLEFGESTMPEWEFVAAVARRSGCALLLDVNNVYVNSVNHGFDAHAYLAAMDPAVVVQYHVAGHEAGPFGLIDTHAAPVSPEVWALYAEAVARLGPRPTIVEWDANLPALDVLLDEAERADAILAGRRAATRTPEHAA
jgi:uncharacterized protein (UPF0276 family)